MNAAMIKSPTNNTHFSAEPSASNGFFNQAPIDPKIPSFIFAPKITWGGKGF
jgi:hypothetical protein